MKFDRRRLLGALAVASACSVTNPARPLASAVPSAPNRPPQTPLLRAVAALDQHAGQIANRDVIGMVDFSAPSRLPRFHLVNLHGGTIDTFLVAHGRGSDPQNSGWVQRLSNEPGSNASCAGSFRTGDTYVGKHGRSRRLSGLDPQNSLAGPRGIVIHAASYVDPAMAREQGRVGRSQGCFAVPAADIDEVLNRLGPGRLLFAWN
jgi:hypothetical protein